MECRHKQFERRQSPQPWANSLSTCTARFGYPNEYVGAAEIGIKVTPKYITLYLHNVQQIGICASISDDWVQSAAEQTYSKDDYNSTAASDRIALLIRL